MTSTHTTTDTTTTPTSRTAHPVTWFEVHTADPARARRFYGDAFGWQFDEMPGYSVVQLGDGAPIAGGIADTQGNRPNGGLFMIQVPDVAAALTAVRANGGSVVADVETGPGGLTFAYGADPDGTVFGIWCPGPEA